MIELYKTASDCCGCSACEAVCPKSNIKMEPIKDGGYLYPKFLNEDNCVDCKLCLKVCPIKKDKTNDAPSKMVYYAGYTNDPEIWKTSTSGGVVTEIFKLYADRNPLYVGARWDGVDSVVMDYADTIEDAGVFRKSKYVAAKSNGIYPVVKKALQDDKLVVFTGTPCQVYGLKMYLKREYENLITVDFACHGQGSPDIFKSWISYLGKKYGSPLTRFHFRERKFMGDYVNSNCAGYDLKDGRHIVVNRDYYHHTFVYGFHMRKSCQNCQFANHRASDVTLADFKSTDRAKYIGHDRNASDIIANTEKGISIINQLKGTMSLYRANIEKEIKANPKLVRGLGGNPQRDMFMSDFYKGMPVERLFKHYARILPSQWVDYNCSEKTKRRLDVILRYLDAILIKLGK